MKVRDLIKELEKVNPGREVIMAGDPEGNKFYPVEEVSDGENEGFTKDGERVIMVLTPELREQGYTDEDADVTAKPCVVVWPG